MNQSLSGMGQSMTLEQWNHQKEMMARVHSAQAPAAGVICRCGTEMRVLLGEVRPEFNMSFGNPNNLTPGQVPNVRCPSCGAVGRKM